MESEGGGEDEGGEGDAVGDQDDREISFASWADNSELNPEGIAHFHLSVDTNAIIAPSARGEREFPFPSIPKNESL